MRALTLSAWLLTIGISYFALGENLGELLEGQQRSRHSTLPLVATLLMLGVSLYLTWRCTHQPARSRPSPSAHPRRDFLLGAGGGLMAAAFFCHHHFLLAGSWRDR